MSSNHNTTYRADIDGLRAIAIVSVVIFHMIPEYLTGGFAGVDIFFVISGYLISLIIMRQMERTTFSFKEFYIKRIIRLFPSLFVVLSFSLMLGWMILLPVEFEQLGKHTASGSGFLANITLFKEVNYFNKASELKPLLHLWSLGIEEQFYFFWPLTLFISWKLRPSLVPYVAIVCIFYSFGININKIQARPEFSFFMPQARFWELIVGGLLAFSEIRRYRIKSQKVANALSIIGLSVCILSFIFLDSSNEFPGYWALLPVIGTAMLINSGNLSWVNSKLLSNKVLVFIGLISYPLYLWHWPLLSFGQIMYNEPPSILIRCMLVILASILAILTYLYVEKPLKAVYLKRRNVAALALLIGIGSIGSIGYLIYKKILAPFSKSNNLAHFSEALNDWDFPGRLKRTIDKHGNIFFSQGDNPNKVVLIGDSNMQQYYPRFEKLLNENPNTLGAIFVTGGACPPIPDMKQDGKYKYCESLINNGFRIAKEANVKKVVIAGQWTSCFTSDRNFYVENKKRKLYLKHQKEGFKLALEQLKDIIISLRKNNKQVYLVLNIPVGPEFSPLSSISRNISLNPIRYQEKLIRRRDFEAYHYYYLSHLKELGEKAGATVIDPLDFLCGNANDYCAVVTKDLKPIYKDSSHLRPFYVREEVQFLDQAFSI